MERILEITVAIVLCGLIVMGLNVMSNIPSSSEIQTMIEQGR